VILIAKQKLIARGSHFKETVRRYWSLMAQGGVDGHKNNDSTINEIKPDVENKSEVTMRLAQSSAVRPINWKE
jgi:hypothetical protein